MRDLEERYGRGSNKRRKHGDDGASTKKPFVKVTAVNNITLTTSFRAGEEVTAVYDSNPTTSSSGVESSWHDNRLLAGYLAHEFLTKGTLLGEQYDPARAEAVPVQSAAKSDSRRLQMEAKPNKGSAKELDRRSYAEVASLLQTEGTHIPGIVNPAELARWIQL